MLAFRQLLSTVSVALLVLHAQQASHGAGLALARPVTGNGVSPAIGSLAAQPQGAGANEDNDATVQPEAGLKALQSLANGIQTQQDSQSPAPVMTTSHGEGGPNKINDAQDSKDTDNKKPNSPKKDPPIAKNANNNKDTDKKDKEQKKTSTNESSKAAWTLLQKPRTRFCAQPSNTNHTADDIAQQLVNAERKRLAAIRLQRTSAKGDATEPRRLTDTRILAEESKTVEVVWHVIHAGRAGNLSDAMIADQIQTLNEDYKSYGFQFNLSNTNRVDNASWFRNINPDGNLQTQMKRSLRKGGEGTLNLYSVDFGIDLLGYASFPWVVQDNLVNDGVVFQYNTVPGSSETGYNLGKTATHEVGHWLGLYHVFQGGCASPGDFVEDTPPQSEATSGCPTNQDSCPGGGLDSIHNYSSDACLTEFTEGQAVRMAALTGQFRKI
ncbi:related to metalloprotease [Ustilago bromivora]|uniref:Related to metalloprotease n=1 Tax=Ustilago bromivora TaxID=307758 RepID=A0A8H8QS93_9BASI|nr:related to metalloprotease [Ustilago bromivora]